MPASHPDFELIQRRLRRLNDKWYPAPLTFDTDYGPGMSRGLDAALTMLEEAHGLAPLTLAPPVRPATAPIGANKLPERFRFLLRDPVAPLMVRVAIDLLGTLEAPGAPDNPVILAWADEVEQCLSNGYNRWAADWYNDDSIPWCGLFMAVVAARAAQGRAERMPPDKYLSAAAWSAFGTPVALDHAAVGDVMVLTRAGGGHVTLFVGLEAGGKRFFGLGGNQSDAVTIAPFPLSRVATVRRPNYQALPPGARRVTVSASGETSSTREA
jgi:uncharacterized protein (TIGR02594 family)